MFVIHYFVFFPLISVVLRMGLFFDRWGKNGVVVLLAKRFEPWCDHMTTPPNEDATPSQVM